MSTLGRTDSATGPGRVSGVALLAACVATAFLGVWRTGFWGPFEPRVLEIAREQYASGRLLHVPTFSGMPFLEKPALYYDLLALSFRVAGGPSVTAARLVHGTLLVVWLGATMLAVRRVAGPRAALLAGCLLASANLFVKLAGRISVDVALAAALALSLLFLSRALSSGRGRIPTGPWLLGLAFGGVAFWSKGFLGSFLFGAPLLAYAAWTRDLRIVRALLRPASLLVLAAPVALWGLVLHAEGGATYVVEAFLNNTLGRFVDHRFLVAGVENLPYGDVNEPGESWEYVTRIGSIAGASLLLLPFAARAVLRRDVRLRGARTRLTALALCFALVPPLLLSFSSQKGVHHLGSCTSGFVIAGALWLHRHAVRRDRRDAPRWLGFACGALAWTAPVAVVAAVLGLPAKRPGAIAAGACGAVAGIGLAVVALRSGSRRLAAYGALAALMLAAIASRSPGGTDAEDLTFNDMPAWVRSRIGSREIGMYGHGDSDLGAFCWALESEMDALSDIDEVARYMSAPGARFCVVRSEESRNEVSALDPSFRIVGIGGNGAREYALVANAAAARLAGDGLPPPR